MNPSLTAGHVAYAKEHADMYETLRRDCELKYEKCGIPVLHNIPDRKTLADQVLIFREQEERIFNYNR